MDCVGGSGRLPGDIWFGHGERRGWTVQHRPPATGIRSCTQGLTDVRSDNRSVDISNDSIYDINDDSSDNRSDIGTVDTRDDSSDTCSDDSRDNSINICDSPLRKRRSD